MKLWLKLSLICTVLLFLIVGISTALLLADSREQILRLTVESSMKELDNLNISLSNMVGYYGKENTQSIVQSSLVRYCFSRLAGKTAALYQGKEPLQSNLVFEPGELLSLDSLRAGESTHKLSTVAGTRILLTGCKTKLLSQEYRIYLVSDITDVYYGISKMVIEFITIATAVILAGSALIVLLVRLATRPLKDLSQSARRIAQGEYDQRADVHTRDEVGELAQDFNAMAEAVQTHFQRQKELMQRQQLFISGLTHEFKTPLTSVIGHSETLLYTKMPEDVAANSLVHIHEQCRWLERLTQKLLRLVALQDEIELKDESVEALLEAARDSVAETLDQRGVALSVSCGVDTLPMDYDLMMSLVINLVDNASKASARGQTVDVLAYDGTIEVRDRGIGIAAEELDKITEPFYMVDRSRSKRLGGSGLGLALVRAIADAHGARLHIQSTPGQGTSVMVIFSDNN